MSLRSILQTAGLAISLVLMACPARSTTDAGTGGGSGGGSGGGGGSKVDSGTGGGTGSADSGTGGGTGSADAGTPPSTVKEARARQDFPTLVALKGVVVTAVSFSQKSGSTSYDCSDTNTKGVNADFWVADPNNAHSGIYVAKFRCDPPSDYMPAVGDVLDLTGYIGFEQAFTGREKLRIVVKEQYDFIQGTKPAKCELASNCQPLVINKTGTMAPLDDNAVSASFGDDGGIKSFNSYAGSRIKFTDPLSIANANPLAFKRISAVPNDSLYYGFQLSNGVLVNNYLTFARFDVDGGLLSDGGTSSCDFRQVVLDGGAVTFASIAGVWDTYTNLQCSDGGTDLNTCFKNYNIPGSNPVATSTNVLYPITCSDFVVQ